MAYIEEGRAQKQNDEVVGFASLASFMASDKEHSASIFRRYERLAARNLLYLQSDLQELENRLTKLDRNDARLEVDRLQSAMDWPSFDERSDVTQSNNSERKALVNELRIKIKEYQKAVLRNERMLALHRPSKQVHRAFTSRFHNTDSASPYPTLLGLNETLYDDRNELVSLARHRDDDRLTTFLREWFPTVFSRPVTPTNHGIGSLSEYRLHNFVGAIDLLVASGILFGAIYALYYLKSIEARLGLVATFTFIFALFIALLTNARRQEIFGACAAYAAVLVVFVSGNLQTQ